MEPGFPGPQSPRSATDMNTRIIERLLFQTMTYRSLFQALQQVSMLFIKISSLFTAHWNLRQLQASTLNKMNNY